MNTGITMTVELKKRLCKLGDRFGYFHCWEHYSTPIEGGVHSKVFGIVELENGVRRFDPTDICFCDEENAMLKEFDEKKEKE